MDIYNKTAAKEQGITKRISVKVGKKQAISNQEAP